MRIITAIVFSVLSFLLCICEILSTANSATEDALFHNPSGASDKIKIIKIDDKSIAALGDFEDWDRAVYAQLVEKLCVSDSIKPAVIGFDILFSSKGDEEADKRFAQACEAHGNVVSAFSYVFEKNITETESGALDISNLYVTDIIEPYPELYNSTLHGFANALMDNDDGYIRSSFIHFDERGKEREYSLNAQIYLAYSKAMGFEPKLPDSASISFKYSGDIGDYENVSLCDVLSGTVPPQAFDDCIVLIGAYAAGMMDSYYVPIDKSNQMYGVEIHANAVQAYLEGKYLYQVPTFISAIIAALISGIIVFICLNLSVVKTVIICVLASAIKLFAQYLLFVGITDAAGYSGDLLTTPVMLALAMLYCIGLHYYLARRSKKSIERAFKKYVAPQVVNEVIKKGGYTLSLGGEERNIAVLFVDLRGFTTMSENLEPPQIVEILNKYFKLVTDCILRHGGTIDKFVGDAAMAVFNAPFDTEEYEYKAVLTAWDMIKGSKALEEELMQRYGKTIGFGVGLSCGNAVVGNVGCDFRMDYTAIGDVVNTAARLESNAPKGKIYISDQIYEKTKELITVDEVGEIPLKGKSNSVFVYSVTGIKDNLKTEEV